MGSEMCIRDSLPPPDRNAPGGQGDLLGINPTLEQLRDGLSFQAHAILPWLTPRRNPLNRLMGDPSQSGGGMGDGSQGYRGGLGQQGRQNQGGNPRNQAETNPTLYPSFQQFVEAFRTASRGECEPSLNGLCFAARLQKEKLIHESMFHRGECRRWTIFGKCPCRGQQEHTQLPEVRLKKIHEFLQPSLEKYLAYTRRRMGTR